MSFSRLAKMLLATVPAFAAAVAQTAPDGVFTLGTVTVVGAKEGGADAVPNQVTSVGIQADDRRTLAAALPLIPGVTMINNGDRNEALISVRGFDSRQVPLFLDGVPVYVPYDGNVDLRRFIAGDVSLISVSKGFSSVLYGPNALGGAINVVTRRPQSPLEGFVAGLWGNENLRGFEARAGALRGIWYAQAYVGSEQENAYRLSKYFHPVATENGGDRENSYYRDRKASFKVGLVPKATDEYAVGASFQRGEKGNPPYAGYDPKQTVRYWRWPDWDKTSVYYVSKTQWEGFYIKPRIYYDEFVNTLSAYDNANYTTQSKGSSFTSFYNDYSWGTSIEGGLSPLAHNTVQAAVHYKRDVHREHNAGQAIIHFIDETSALGLEDTWQIAPEFSAVGGLEFERRHSVTAQTLVGTTLGVFPGNDDSDANPEVGLYYQPAGLGAWHLTVARKTRFPTLKDRYSYRLGQALPNAALRPERALHYEVGYDGTFIPGINFRIAGFISRLNDAIIQVNNIAISSTGVSLYQLQNASRAENHGVEVGLDGKINSWLKWSGNYTWLHRENKTDPTTRFIDTPQHRFLAQLEISPGRSFSIIPDFEYATDRYSTSYGIVAPGYAKTDLHLRWKLPDHLTASGTLSNAFDRNYFLREGYPEAGRSIDGRIELSF